jgi:uncharacterized membrane protein
VDGVLFGITLAAAVGAGLVGGVFFAFSNFVMQGLGRLRPPEGLRAMQAINVTVINPLFMGALFGMGLLSLVLAGWGIAGLDEPYAGWLIAGGAVYFAGEIVVTSAYNVPRNNAMARVDPDSEEGARVWETYLVEWTRGNHVRTVAGLAACGLFALGLQAG